MQNKTFAQIVGSQNYTISINGYPMNINNTNELLGNLYGVYGIKTGFTNGANRCLVTCCKRNDMDIICVVLGADTKSFRTKDSIKLIEYTFKNFKPVNVQDLINDEFNTWKKSNENTFNIIKGLSNDINLKVSEIQNPIIPIFTDDISKLKVEIECERTLIAPININYDIGDININVDGKIIEKYDILTQDSINKKSVFDYLFLFIKNYNTYFQNII